MNRRFLLQSVAAGLLPATARAEVPWSMGLLQGGFDGKAYRAGLQVNLLPHWKTYWRMPGAGGISPAIDATGQNLKSFGFDFPLPQRFMVAADEVIGYMDEVVFPLRIEPVDFSLPVTATLQAFIGVCEVVCIPAKFEQTLVLSPGNAQASDAAVISDWHAKVPKLSGADGPLRAATALTTTSGFAVKLELATPVKDIFAEGKSAHYFHAPQFDGNTASLTVSGVKILDELKNTPLRLTFTLENGSLEQFVTVG